MIYWIIESILAVTIIARYIMDNKTHDKDTRSRVSEYHETFIDYTKEVIGINAGVLVFFAIIIWVLGNFLDNIVCLHVVGIIYLLGWQLCLPLSKSAYLKWLNEAPEREHERVKLAEEMKATEAKERIRNWLYRNGEQEYINNEIKRLNLNTTKTIRTSEDSCLIVDDINKQFANISVYKVKFEEENYANLDEELYLERIRHCTEKEQKKHFKAVINKYSIKELQNWSSEDIKNQLLVDYYGTRKPNIVFNFKDLIRVQVVDKTQVDTERSFTMESNAGKAIAGAFLGEFLMGGVMSAPVGAIAGAAGERKITENVKKTTTVAFDVVLYLNRLDNNVHTISLNSESQLREVVGALEYILNNKGE